VSLTKCSFEKLNVTTSIDYVRPKQFYEEIENYVISSILHLWENSSFIFLSKQRKMQYLKLALLCFLGADTADAFSTTSFVNKKALSSKAPLRNDSRMKMVAGGAQAYEEMYDGTLSIIQTTILIEFFN